MSEPQNNEGLRIDKWLWHTRFFKSRSQATDAVAGGLVHVNDERVKPSREVRMGDHVLITRATERYHVVVTALPLRRGPASVAQSGYQETPESIAARQLQRERAKHAPPAPFGRPDKHERRALQKLRGR
jgi:ribosome-associated heat shock protein Hsp15